MKVSIFNLNTWLLPFWLSKDNKKRIDRLIDFINKSKPDIIALQEVWLNPYLFFLKKNLLEYHFIYEASTLFNRSGLLVISKEKPISHDFFMFKKKTFLHKILKRGMQLVRFKEFSVCNTHLHIVPGNQDKKIATEEFEFVKSKLSEEKNCFLCGDLNLDIKEFKAVNEGFFKHAENTRNTFSEGNPYVHKWWDPKIMTNKKIDYILAKNPADISFKSKIIKERLSDHYGIYSEINIK